MLSNFLPNWKNMRIIGGGNDGDVSLFTRMKKYLHFLGLSLFMFQICVTFYYEEKISTLFQLLTFDVLDLCHFLLGWKKIHSFSAAHFLCSRSVSLFTRMQKYPHFFDRSCFIFRSVLLFIFQICVTFYVPDLYHF